LYENRASEAEGLISDDEDAISRKMREGSPPEQYVGNVLVVEE